MLDSLECILVRGSNRESGLSTICYQIKLDFGLFLVEELGPRAGACPTRGMVVHVCMHIYIYMSTYICIHIYVHTYAYNICIYVYIYVNVSVNVCEDPMRARVLPAECLFSS